MIYKIMARLSALNLKFKSPFSVLDQPNYSFELRNCLTKLLIFL